MSENSIDITLALKELLSRVEALSQQQKDFEKVILHNQASTAIDQLVKMSPNFRRNFLQNDDAALQKNLIEAWRAVGRAGWFSRDSKKLSHADLMNSGFRVFSQNDEDGILLRLFSHIGHTNRYVIEIGSNCSGSDVDIPENLSTNLIVNHGWHGSIFEMDSTECNRLRYFFARNHSTRHFHWDRDGENVYFSPVIVNQAVTPENINQLLTSVGSELEPDLMIIDIDGGDYSVIESLRAARPRVLVVEFEKRFREHHSVVQFDSAQFGNLWRQSGAASLSAWDKLLAARGYSLSAISASGFNAFFVRSDVSAGKLVPLSVKDAFDSHPIFSTLSQSYWMVPDETWQMV